MNARVSNIIALVVVTVWALSFIADIFMTTYEPPAAIHAIMMTVAGAAFAGSVVKRNGNGGDK